MFTGTQIVETLNEMEITHVVWVPDSTIGEWETALRESDRIELVGVCREGEAWALAAGLSLGGANPLVMIQCTGLFESGDALRNVLYDYRLPLFALIGYRSYLNQSSLPGDTAMQFAEPLLKAWKLDYVLVDTSDKRELIAAHYHRCRTEGRAGAILLAEGRA